MYKYLKTLIDYFLALTILIIVFPLLILTFFTILLFDRVNPIFYQTRSGFNQKKFKIYKFNSMKNTNGNLKITKLGKIIRKLKIDELPQLFNVLKDDMSLIGPRPLYPDFDPYYQSTHLRRFSCKPGITGLAQVNVYDSTKWRQKFTYDSFYAKNLCFYLDLIIIIHTFKLLYLSYFNKKSIKETINYKESFFSNYVKK